MPRPKSNRLLAQKSEDKLPAVLKRSRGRKPAVKPSTTSCLNCAALVSFENAGRKLSEPLHQRASRTHLEKILEDRSSSDPSSVRQVLDVIFDLSERAAAAGRRLDVRNSILCWKCTMILRQLHKLFGEFVEAAVDPSLMTAVYGQSCLLAEFQAGLHDAVHSDEENDDRSVPSIKQEPVSEEEELPTTPETQRETRIPRSCKKALNYKKLNMGKEEEYDEDSEYILPEPTKKTPIVRSLLRAEILLPEKRQRRKMKKKNPSPKASIADLEEKSEDEDSKTGNETEAPVSPCPANEDDGEEPKEKKPRRKYVKRVTNDGKENKTIPKIPCPVCKKNLLTEELLQAHLELKHIPYTRVKTHHCPECTKMFWSKHDLKNHILTHTRQPCFVCDQCGYKTKRPQELARHQKLVHLNEKNFHCDVCGKGYALKWQLTDHARVHKDERTFHCTAPGCDKAFRTPSNLRQHLELHKGSKYVCHVCGLSYSRKAYLRLHVNAAHLGKPFPPARKRDPLARPPRPRLPRTKVIGTGLPPKPKRRREPSYGKAIIRKINYPTLNDKPIKNLVRVLPQTTISVHESPGSLCNEDDDRILVLTEYNPEEHDLELITEDSQMEDEEDEVLEGEVVEVVEDDGDDGAIKLVEVHMMEDEEGMMQDEETEETEVEEHHYTISDDQQIICYPVSSLGVVQNVPVAISTAMAGSSNTFYITTQQGSDEATDVHGNSINVYNPFQEFMSLQ